MMRIAAAALFAGIGEPELIAWIDRGWIHPAGAGGFEEIDIARIRLIQDLRVSLRIADDTVPVLLSLLDQVYETRGQLRAVLRAIDAQPETVREAILTALR